MPTFSVDTLLSNAVPLLMAACLGGIVGWEREAWRKPAGLRTHMMVALGASAFTHLALILVAEGSSVTEGSSGADPSRIIEGIATGIGFLGAGSIIHSRGEIRGITTAAGVWVVGGVGACCGAEQYELAVLTVFFSVVILTLLHKVSTGISTKEPQENGE